MVGVPHVSVARMVIVCVRLVCRSNSEITPPDFDADRPKGYGSQ